MRATAMALVAAVAQADIFCEATGGDSARPCGLAQEDVRAVTHAQVCPAPHIEASGLSRP